MQILTYYGFTSRGWRNVSNAIGDALHFDCNEFTCEFTK